MSKTILITGATAGFGRTRRQSVSPTEAGKSIGTGRRGERLRELAGAAR